jgi:hypothetical protein
MDFELPEDIGSKLRELDAFIQAEIKPLEPLCGLTGSATYIWMTCSYPIPM